MSRAQDPPRVAEHLLPPVQFLIALLAMVALHLLAPGATVVPDLLRWIGVPALLAGAALNVAATGWFDRAGTAARPFERSTRLVTGGPYRFTRNPMYLGMLLLLAGVALLLRTAAPFGVIPILAASLHFGFVLPEERALGATFGAGYEAYRRRVRRWI